MGTVWTSLCIFSGQLVSFIPSGQTRSLKVRCVKGWDSFHGSKYVVLATNANIYCSMSISHNMKTHGRWYDWQWSWMQYNVLEENPGSSYSCRCILIPETRPQHCFRRNKPPHDISHSMDANFVARSDYRSKAFWALVCVLCHVPPTVPEQSFWCGSTHCPARGQCQGEMSDARFLRVFH